MFRGDKLLSLMDNCYIGYILVLDILLSSFLYVAEHYPLSSAHRLYDFVSKGMIVRSDD
jgi:hypothetical protein